MSSINYCVKERKGCVGWVERYLKDCLCNVKDEFSFGFGLTSLVCWGVAEIPQIITNFRTKSSHGVSLLFLLTWVAGDIFNLTGCLLEPATLPTQFYTALLYTISTVVLVLQGVYYDHIFKRLKGRHTKAKRREEDEKKPLAPKSGDAAIPIPKASVKSSPRREYYYTSARSLASSGTPPFRTFLRAAQSGPSALGLDNDSSSDDEAAAAVPTLSSSGNPQTSQPRAIPRSAGYGTFLAASVNLPFQSNALARRRSATETKMESCCSTCTKLSSASPSHPCIADSRGFGRKFTRNSLDHHLLSSSLPKPFLQVNNARNTFLYRRSSSRFPSTASRGIISAEAWDFGRFLKTLYFFNGPPSPAKFVEFLVEKLSGPSPKEPVKAMETSGIVLVAGATGGVGRRVVDILRNKGLPVRVLVRNEEKARKMLGPDVDLIVGDITKENTLTPEYFKGVRKVINAVSVIVGPKEGDTPDRAKYSQGIKFFEPEIKGDSPEMVEYLGMRNLINAVKGSVGLQNGKLLFGFEENSLKELPWGALDDVVMGGVSESTFQIDRTGGENGAPTGLFKGVVSTTNNGGFTSIRTRNFAEPEDLSAYDGLELRLKGDGRRYKFVVRTSSDWDTVGYTASFDTVGGQWQSIRLPFSSLRPIFRARTVLDAPPFDPSNIVSLQLMFSKFEYDGKLNPTFVEGAFQLPVSSIQSYIKDPVTPRFVHVSSAGVTRPERPGLDLSKQPPAVRLNKELGFILTFKLKGEDLIRESGIPYTIVRPCALTEEPAGADLIFDQGDNITGKISREEVARICVAALESPFALDKTFEVKSTIPFSESFTVDPENPPQEKDYNIYFKGLTDGITGKESLEQSPVPV